MTGNSKRPPFRPSPAQLRRIRYALAAGTPRKLIAAANHVHPTSLARELRKWGIETFPQKIPLDGRGGRV